MVDFWTGKKTAGAQRIEVRPPLEQIPMFVKGGTVLPLAEPSLHTEDPAGWKISVRVYGDSPALTPPVRGRRRMDAVAA
jgi:alpha-D-xyloside xylohydrolase